MKTFHDVKPPMTLNPLSEACPPQGSLLQLSLHPRYFQGFGVFLFSQNKFCVILFSQTKFWVILFSQNKFWVILFS